MNYSAILCANCTCTCVPQFKKLTGSAVSFYTQNYINFIIRFLLIFFLNHFSFNFRKDKFRQTRNVSFLFYRSFCSDARIFFRLFKLTLLQDHSITTNTYIMAPIRVWT